MVLLTSECEIKTNTMQNYTLELSIIMHIPNEIINQSKSLVTSLDGINGNLFRCLFWEQTEKRLEVQAFMCSR